MPIFTGGGGAWGDGRGFKPRSGPEDAERVEGFKFKLKCKFKDTLARGWSAGGCVVFLNAQTGIRKLPHPYGLSPLFFGPVFIAAPGEGVETGTTEETVEPSATGGKSEGEAAA
jgi:hypothetical protein